MIVSEYIAKIVAGRVNHIFGYQGSAALKLIDSMVANGVEYVQTYHEQAAALAADAYARTTGKLGVAIATSGPGATNLVTGIANAYYDSIPTLFITGQDYLSSINGHPKARQNGFQAADVVGICTPITKYAKLITSPDEVPFELGKAIYLAESGRPGPVLLDIPMDIQFKEIPEEHSTFVAPREDEPDIQSVAIEVLARLKVAKRPVILAGGGVRLAGAVNVFRHIAEQTRIPVITTLNALDVYAGAHSFAGLYGNTSANLIANNADVLLVLGSRLGLRQVTKFKADYTSASVIHVDIDPHERNRGLASDLFITAHLKPFLSTLDSLCVNEQPLASQEWLDIVNRWDAQYLSNSQVNTAGLDPVALVRAITSQCTESTIFTADVGQNQMWVAQGFQMRGEQRLLNSSGHGAMGFSLPAAIGAKYAAPERHVLAFTGDGGLMMNIQELQTLAHRRLGIKCVVFNNNTLGMMREVQALYYGSRFIGSCKKDFACPSLSLQAKAYGLGYAQVNNLGDIGQLTAALTDHEPWIIDISLPLDSRALNRYDEKMVFEQEKIRD